MHATAEGLTALAIVMTAACGDAGVSPEAARALQTLNRARFDSTHHVEVQSPENTAYAGHAIYSDVSHDGDIWLLRQRTATSNWMRYGIAIRDGRVYFAILDRRGRLEGAGCVQCHANGPRALRGGLRAGVEADRGAMNASAERIGVVQPYYPPSDPLPAAAARRLDAARCDACHDGTHRAALTAASHLAIAFLVGSGDMPPDGPLTPAERSHVDAFTAVEHR
jgi:hypothetical protein